MFSGILINTADKVNSCKYLILQETGGFCNVLQRTETVPDEDS